VSKTGFQSHVLDKASTINESAQRFASSISEDGTPLRLVKQKGDELVKLILPMSLEPLQGKRLVIVGDGSLHTVPFAAAALQSSPNYTPLLTYRIHTTSKSISG
jgi:CHAT domain-containing protein